MAFATAHLPMKPSRQPEPTAAGDEREDDELRFRANRLHHWTAGPFFELPLAPALIGREPVWPDDGERMVPVADVARRAEILRFDFEVPGLGPEDLEVTVRSGVLTVEGKKTGEAMVSGHGYHRAERRFGALHRRFALPEGADTEAVEALLKNGVLTVTVPVSTRRHDIPVSA